MVEVKGLSGSDLSVHLSPNEFRYSNAQHRGYRLAIVYHALDDPTLILLKKRNRTWVVDRKRSAVVDERIVESAVVDVYL